MSGDGAPGFHVRRTQARADHEADVVCLELAGEWTVDRDRPGPEDAMVELAGHGEAERVLCGAAELRRWDSSLLTFIRALGKQLESRGQTLDPSGLPRGARRLLELAAAVPEPTGGRREGGGGFFGAIGLEIAEFLYTGRQMLEFLGETWLALGSVARARARFRWRDVLALMQECGAEALPIVSLISLLVGMILAFVGSVQLSLLGAEIYVASLVGIAMVRVMGAIMTGVIMAGRTGAAYAAQLGTMQANEEIDALRTIGISPMEFLVLPRVFALATMMPLLCLYANFMGVLGGAAVGVGLLDIGLDAYMRQTWDTVRLQDFWIGLFHGWVFGVLVALAGCMHGIHSGRTAAAVGDATTSAVVTGIVSIVVATAVITVVCNVLGI